MGSVDIQKAPEGTYDYLKKVYEKRCPKGWENHTHWDLAYDGTTIVQVNRARGWETLRDEKMLLTVNTTNTTTDLLIRITFNAVVNPDDTLEFLSSSDKDIQPNFADILKTASRVIAGS